MKKITKAAKDNGVVKGIHFLGKSIASQRKALLSITAIFMLLVLALAIITLLLNLVIVDGGHFNVSYIDGEEQGLTYGTACWWVFITISTIGYGDIYPISSLMRVWAIVISLIGIAFLALYTAIIVNGFTQEFQRRRLLGEDGGALSTGADIEEDTKIKKLMTENKKLKKEIKDLKNNN